MIALTRISSVNLKSKEHEKEIIKYQIQINRFMVVLNKKKLLPSVIQ